MNVFRLFFITAVACAMQVVKTAAAPNFTLGPINTQTSPAAKLPLSTTWIDRSDMVPLMDYPEKTLCMIPNFWAAHRTSISHGIDYLNNHGGSVLLGPGPGNCSRVSCSEDSGIYVCNDNPYTIGINLHTVANFTYAIYNNIDCIDPTSYGDNSQGQAFSSYGWNTIVGQLIGGGWC